MYVSFDESQRNENGYVTVKSLAELLNQLVEDGKGDYEVLVEFHKLNEYEIEKGRKIGSIDLCN